MEDGKRGIARVWGRIKGVEFLPLIMAYIILCVFFSLTSRHFLVFKNFMNIFLNAAIMGILTLSTTLVLSAGKIDFSAGAVIAFGSCLMGIMLRAGISIWLCIPACLAVCVLTGVYNGVMIAYVGLSPFITTLAGMQMFRGFAYLMTNARSITVSEEVLKFVGRRYTASVPNAVWLLLLLAALFVWIANRTTFGRKTMVIGGNDKVAFLCGINVRRHILKLFMLHGFMVGISTVVYTGQLGAALPTAAQNLNFQSISACVLGGISLSGGKGSIVGGVIGAMMIATLNNGMTMLELNAYWQDVVYGFVLIFAVTMDILKNRRAAKAAAR
ncbi:MAG: ABC transporter permease [Clostridiales bacterium]|nr:ABC transporter permease [Clostridiales bacterium]